MSDNIKITVKLNPELVAGTINEDELVDESTMESFYAIRMLKAAIHYGTREFEAMATPDLKQIFLVKFDIWLQSDVYEIVSDKTYMSKAEISEKLESGVVNFRFKKADGSARDAIGTRNNDLIPVSKMPVSKPLVEGAPVVAKKPEPENLVRYYDFQASGWRSFKTDFCEVI